MGPAEIVASLKELCADKGPKLSTEQIVDWIDDLGGFERDAELIAFAKKMKARQYARMLEFEDEESGLRIKRLWSFYDSRRGRRYYADILEMPADPASQVDPASMPGFRSNCGASDACLPMADYFAGQQFFDFYPWRARRRRGRSAFKETRNS